MNDQSGYIGPEIGQAVVDHAMYISTLAVAILGGIVVIRHQYNLSAKFVPDLLCAFWFAAGLAALTVGTGLYIFGLYIELTPILKGFEFDLNKKFDEQIFENNGIGSFRAYSRVQMGAFAGLLITSGMFVFRNLQFHAKRSEENESSSTH